MFVASGYAPALIDRLTEGTDKGINFCESSWLIAEPLFVHSFPELDEQTLHLNIKWHHAWGRRVISPNQTAAMDMSGPQEVITAEAYYGAQATPYALTV